MERSILQNLSHSPRLSAVQYNLTVQNRSLKHHSFHFIKHTRNYCSQKLTLRYLKSSTIAVFCSYIHKIIHGNLPTCLDELKRIKWRLTPQKVPSNDYFTIKTHLQIGSKINFHLLVSLSNRLHAALEYIYYFNSFKYYMIEPNDLQICYVIWVRRNVNALFLD